MHGEYIEEHQWLQKSSNYLAWWAHRATRQNECLQMPLRCFLIFPEPHHYYVTVVATVARHILCLSTGLLGESSTALLVMVVIYANFLETEYPPPSAVVSNMHTNRAVSYHWNTRL